MNRLERAAWERTKRVEQIGEYVARQNSLIEEADWAGQETAEVAEWIMSYEEYLQKIVSRLIWSLADREEIIVEALMGGMVESTMEDIVNSLEEHFDLDNDGQDIEESPHMELALQLYSIVGEDMTEVNRVLDSLEERLDWNS